MRLKRTLSLMLVFVLLLGMCLSVYASGTELCEWEECGEEQEGFAAFSFPVGNENYGVVPVEPGTSNSPQD